VQPTQTSRYKIANSRQKLTQLNTANNIVLTNVGRLVAPYCPELERVYLANWFINQTSSSFEVRQVLH